MRRLLLALVLCLAVTWCTAEPEKEALETDLDEKETSDVVEHLAEEPESEESGETSKLVRKPFILY